MACKGEFNVNFLWIMPCSLLADAPDWGEEDFLFVCFYYSFKVWVVEVEENALHISKNFFTWNKTHGNFPLEMFCVDSIGREPWAAHPTSRLNFSYSLWLYDPCDIWDPVLQKRIWGKQHLSYSSFRAHCSLGQHRFVWNWPKRKCFRLAQQTQAFWFVAANNEMFSFDFFYFFFLNRKIWFWMVWAVSRFWHVFPVVKHEIYSIASSGGGMLAGPRAI